MKTTATLLAGTMLAMTAGAPAFANSNGQDMQNGSGQQQSQHKNAGGTFDGTITSLRTVKFDNGKEYVLARIKDEQGHTAVLDLGTEKNLSDQNADVKEGQQIQASGRSGRLNDKPILVVYSFKTNSQNGSTSSSSQ